MEPSYELFDHTADMGIRVRAATLPELLQPAAGGLYEVIGRVKPRAESATVSIDLNGEEAAVLLRDYLAELLLLFDCDVRMAVSVDVGEFNDNRLVATVKTCAVDPKRSVFHREVKAITYHELDVREIPGGYEATLIVDI